MSESMLRPWSRATNTAPGSPLGAMTASPAAAGAAGAGAPGGTKGIPCGLLISPPSVEFRQTEPVVQTAIITVKNMDARTKTVRLRNPKGQFFSTHGFHQSIKLSGGLETTFEVVYDGTRWDDSKEYVQDVALIQCDTGEVAVTLRATLPQPNVSVLGDLNFGVLPVETKATKNLQMINAGDAPTTFRVDWDRTLPLTVEPNEGELGPAGSPSCTLALACGLTVADVSSLAGEISITLGARDVRKVGISATAVKQSFELLDTSGVLLSELDFGSLFLGESSKQTLVLFNNGPSEARFIVSHGTLGEMRGKVEEGGNTNTADPDDPYADYIMAARQKAKARSTGDNPFTISPLTGALAPFSRATITIGFAPTEAPVAKGFAVTAPLSDQTARLHDYMAVVEFGGNSAAKLKLPIRAKSFNSGLTLSPSSLTFGDVPCNQWADQLLTLANTNNSMPANFEMMRADAAGHPAPPYFSVQPPSGTVLPGQSVQLLLRYNPKALGRHGGTLPFRVTSERGHVVQWLALSASGTSLRAGDKPPLVGGTDKLPKHFEKPANYVSDEQVMLSTLEAAKRTGRFMAKPWEKPDVAPSLEDVRPGSKVTYSKEELMALSEHRDKYTTAMRARRLAKAKEASNRRFDENDINMGLDTRSGLHAPEPKLPKSVDPLWTVELAKEAVPRTQRTWTDRDLQDIVTHPDKPQSDVERVQCIRELSKDDLARLVVGPRSLDFGHVSVGSCVSQWLVVANTLEAPIHVVLDLKSKADFRMSANCSQVIPPGARAKFPVTLSSVEARSISEHIEYTINSNHVLNFTVSAQVVPVSLELSTEDLHFEFTLDSWDEHIERVLLLDNPHRFPVEYSLSITGPDTFSMLQTSGVIKPQSSGEVAVRWSPQLDGSLSGTQEAYLAVEMLGSDGPRRVYMRGEMPEGNLRVVREKALDVGPVTCGIPQTAMVQIKNYGTREAAFRVLPNPALKVSPERARVAPDEVLDVELTFTVHEPSVFTTPVAVEILGGRTLKLQLRAEGVVPMVEVLEDELAFPATYVGTVARVPLTLQNVVPVPAHLMVDLTPYPEFQIVIAKDAWSTAEYEECPLQRVGPHGESLAAQSIGSRRNSHAGSRRSASRRSSSTTGWMGSPGEGFKFHINVNPSAKLSLLLVYRPTHTQSHTLELALRTLTTGVASPPPVRKVVTAEGLQPRLVLSRTNVDFGTRVVIRSNQIKAPYMTELYITNTDNEPVSVAFGDCATTATATVIAPPHTAGQPTANGKGVPGTAQPGGRAAKGQAAAAAAAPPPTAAPPPPPVPVMAIFDHDVPKGTTLEIEPQQMVQVLLRFTPRDAKLYEATIPVFLNGDSKPYLHLEITGTGQYPRLTFDVRECVLPPVPLGIESTAVFHVINNGYDNLELSFRLPADDSHVPVQLEFPEGTMIGIAKERLPVVVRFQNSKPVSFTANVDFMDEDGKRYSVAVTGTTDNSLLTHQAFLKVNSHQVQYSAPDDGPVSLVEQAVWELPPQSMCLGPSEGLVSVARYLNATTTRGPFEPGAMHLQLLTSRGKLLLELLEVLSGKTVPGKVGKISSQKKEASRQLLQQYDSALVFLKSHGALLNAIKPEMLLEQDDFVRVLNDRGNATSSPEELQALELWDDVEENFETVSAQAWNMVMLQVFKVFVLSRVTLKSLRSLPALAPLEYPSDGCLLGSNLYSLPESVLLAWMSTHFQRELGSRAHRLTNFDEDLRNSVVFFCVLTGYWPSLAGRRKSLNFNASTDLEFMDNAEVLVKMVQDLGLPYDLTAADIARPDAREMVVFCMYLYHSLPQLVPRSTIEFTCRLGETQTKDLELTNPSKRAIAYSARLEGNKDFSLETTMVRIEPKGAVRLSIKAAPTTTVPQEARLVLMSRRDSGAAAATLVFTLYTKVNTRAPLRRVRTEGPLYDLQQFEFTLANPFPADGDVTIQLLHEPAEPLPKKEPEPPPKKGRGGASHRQEKKAPEPPPVELPKPGVWPVAFGLDRTRVRLKQNASERIRGFFLPFWLGPHYCTVIFKDKEQGEFCYELVGEAGLPAPMVETKGTVALEVPPPQQFVDVGLQYLNPQLEMAKRLFVDRHPLGKDREMALLLKQDPFKSAGEMTYTCRQTNTLVSVPQTLTLVARPIATATASENTNYGTPSHGGNMPGTAGSNAPVPPDPNTLRLQLRPIGVGIYPTRVMLTSAYDTRVVDVELTAQTMTQNFVLEFSTTARQSMTQDVPLVNASDTTMTVMATITGQAYSGGREMLVPAGATIGYPLTFKPITPGEYKGQLELAISATGERNIYQLIGRASEPVAEGHLVIECQARRTATKAIAVPNIVGGPTEYQVLCDLDFISGQEKVRVGAGQGATYKILASPGRSGTFHGSMTFTTEDKQYVWYSVEVRATEPPEVGAIQVTSSVRRAVAVGLSIINPLDKPLEMFAKYSHPALVGPGAISLPAGGPGSQPVAFEFYFAPLMPGDSTGSVTLVNDEVGEFWYKVEMHAEPALPEALPELVSELGRRASTTLPIDNPLPKPVVVAVTSSNPRNFAVSPAMVTIPPYASAEVTVEYTPSTLDGCETADVTVDAQDAGTWAYHASGRGSLPTSMEPATIAAALGSVGQGMLTWQNPFAEPMTAVVNIDTAEPAGTFELMLRSRTATVAPFGTLQIPISFTPSSLATATAEAQVVLEGTSYSRDPLTWRYPLQAYAEAPGSVFRYKCKARGQLDELMEVMLVGLSHVSQDEEFSHQLVIPPENRQLLEGVLSITAVDVRLKSADQPLQFGVSWAPRVMHKPVTAELVVTKASGGRWRFEIQLQATEPDLDGVITIEAAMGQTATVPIFICSPRPTAQPFTATFSPETPLTFNVLPSQGMLPPAARDTSPRSPNAREQAQQQVQQVQQAQQQQQQAPLCVTYTCREFGKEVRGRLYIHTEGMQWSYELRGKVPDYVPPTPAQFAPSVDDRLAPELLARLNGASSRGGTARNFVAANARATRALDSLVAVRKF